MQRRDFLKYSGAAAAGVATSSIGRDTTLHARQARSGSGRPNILMITCHDMGRHIGCYGVKTVRTDNLDAL
ncbi:MAG: twin-arginine translocation signal domain-containing protein, partial [Phycisphaerales bacterium]